MFKYETHLHTLPVSKCARVNVKDNLEFYKSLGYDGVFITNHFIDGNGAINKDMPYEWQIETFFSDYDDGVALGREIGIRVFCGAEMSYKGTDFLVYGLGFDWYVKHPEIVDMKKSQLLPFLMENGALVIQAHPYREAKYIDHIRLFPRCVHGVEIDNACRSEFENEMARHYADAYGLLHFAGSDNHVGIKRPRLSGMEFDTPIADELDFVSRIKNGEGKMFSLDNPFIVREETK